MSVTPLVLDTAPMLGGIPFSGLQIGRKFISSYIVARSPLRAVSCNEPRIARVWKLPTQSFSRAPRERVGIVLSQKEADGAAR